MFNPDFQVIKVFSKKTARKIVDHLRKEGEWQDGLKSTHGMSNETKNNLELKNCVEYAEYVRTKLKESKHYEMFSLRSSTTTPIISKTGVGQYYNLHTDDPIVGDISTTTFLSNPSDYEGGELCIFIGGEVKKFKLDAGWAVVYNRGVPHQVQTVTSGERIVAVNWCRSLIGDYDKRVKVRKLFHLRERLKETFPDYKENKSLSIEEGLNDPWWLLRDLCNETLNEYRQDIRSSQ